jgi:hypothetical protein
MSVVQTYWGGVLQRLRAEVDVFSRLVTHHGERGRANELALARVLERLLPRRFEVGTGLAIDSHGAVSKQNDIVLAERSDEPAVLAQTTELLHPIETVLACIEVKTQLQSAHIEEALAQKQALLALTPARSHPDGSRHPLFAMLAFQSAVRPAQISDLLAEGAPADRPDLLCVLRPGILAAERNLISRDSSETHSVGLVLLAEQNEQGETTGDYLFRDPSGSEMTVFQDGSVYPLVKYQDGFAVSDSGRALLLFVEALMWRMARMQKRDDPVLTYYLDEGARDVAWLDD